MHPPQVHGRSSALVCHMNEKVGLKIAPESTALDDELLLNVEYLTPDQLQLATSLWWQDLQQALFGRRPQDQRGVC